MEASGELGQRLGLAEQGAVTILYDVIIIGGGPAGLSASVYAVRKVLKTLLVSKDIGGQVAWTYDVDNYLGFSQVEAADLIAKFEEHVEKYGVEKLDGKESPTAQCARGKEIDRHGGNLLLHMRCPSVCRS